MVPIWGEYISIIRKDIGTLFKEFYTFQLLNRTRIMTSPAVEKLKIYIDNIVGKGNLDSTNILKGISSEDFSYWLLSLVCVKRICIADLSGIDPKVNIVTYVYKFIIQKVQNGDNNVEKIVKDKRIDDKTVSSENKISTLECYKMKTNISPGEIVELEYSIRDIVNVVNKLTYTVDLEHLNNSLATSSFLDSQTILNPQMTLLRWVFKPVISPRGILYLPKSMIVRALGALESVLWARGHKYLAILATSYSVSHESEMIISPVDSKMRISKELAAELDYLYPFTKPNLNKKLNIKGPSMVMESIDNLADEFMAVSWKPTCDVSMLQEVLGSSTRRVGIKPDIKTDLAKLVIELGNRSWI